MRVGRATSVVCVAAAALCVIGTAAAWRHPTGRGEIAAGRVLSRNEFTASYWTQDAQEGLQRRLQTFETAARAKNVIMFLGDGMSVPTLAAARALGGQRQGQTGEEAHLAFEEFPISGLVKTYCVDAQIPDSACTATSYLCGVKTNQGILGITANVSRYDCAGTANTDHHVDSIAAWALQDGRDAGIVTTTRVTHASPAGAYAHSANRNWESDADVTGSGYNITLCPDIAQQLTTMYPGNQFKVILGGGRRTFIPTTFIDEQGTAGRRTDGRNLIEEWQQMKTSEDKTSAYVWNKNELQNVDYDNIDYLLGLFTSTHMQYNMQAPDSQPSLADMTEAAIKMLSKNEKGYFLFVEGGRIDHGHHANYVELALDETLEMSEAVARAVELTDVEDTLIVVTSDHAHVMAYNGYSARGNDILGASRDRDDDGVPYMTLSYTNGPGFRSQVNGTRSDVTQESNYMTVSSSSSWRTHVEVPLSSETHGGDDVAVFARGPRSHVFTGVYEQSHLPHLMGYASCLGPGLTVCNSVNHATASLASSLPLNLALAVVTAHILRR